MPSRKRVKSCVDESSTSKPLVEPLSKRCKRNEKDGGKRTFCSSSSPLPLPPEIPDLQPPPNLTVAPPLPLSFKTYHMTASTKPKPPIALLRVGTSLPSRPSASASPLKLTFNETKRTPAASALMDTSTILRSLPQFLRSLWEMVVDPSIDDVIGWHPTRTCTFVVRDVATFESTHLPKHFKHKKLASFVRQLNMYQFRKVRNTEAKSKKKSPQSQWQKQLQKQMPLMWTHDNFQKGRVDLLPAIRRRDPTARHKALTAAHTPSASAPSIGSNLLPAIGSAIKLAPASGSTPIGVEVAVGSGLTVASPSLRHSVADSTKAKVEVITMDISTVKTQIISMHQSFSSSILSLEAKLSNELKSVSASLQAQVNVRHRAVMRQLDSFMKKQRLAFELLRKELKAEIRAELTAAKPSAAPVPTVEYDFEFKGASDRAAASSSSASSDAFKMPTLALCKSSNESSDCKDFSPNLAIEFGELKYATSECELKGSGSSSGLFHLTNSSGSSLEQSERDAVKLLVSLSDKRGKQKRRFETKATDKGKGAKVSLSSSLPQLSYAGDEDRDSVVAEDERGAAFEPLSKSKRNLLFSPSPSVEADSGEEEEEEEEVGVGAKRRDAKAKSWATVTPLLRVAEEIRLEQLLKDSNNDDDCDFALPVASDRLIHASVRACVSGGDTRSKQAATDCVNVHLAVEKKTEAKSVVGSSVDGSGAEVQPKPESGTQARNIVAVLTDVATGMPPTTATTLPIPASLSMASASSLSAVLPLPVSSATSFYPSFQMIAAPMTAQMPTQMARSIPAPMTTASGTGVYFSQPSFVFPPAIGGGFAMGQVVSGQSVVPQQLDVNGCLYVTAATPVFLESNGANANGYVTRKA